MIWPKKKLFSKNYYFLFLVLREIFDYLDTFELLKASNHKRSLTKNDIGNFLPKFLNKGINQEELKVIFTMFEDDNEASAKTTEFHQIMHAFD